MRVMQVHQVGRKFVQHAQQPARRPPGTERLRVEKPRRRAVQGDVRAIAETDAVRARRFSARKKDAAGKARALRGAPQIVHDAAVAARADGIDKRDTRHNRVVLLLRWQFTIILHHFEMPYKPPHEIAFCGE